MSTTLQVPLVRVGEHAGAHIDIEVPESLKFANDGNLPTPKHKMFRIITVADGDQRVVWDSSSLADVQEAKKLFDQMKQKGLSPHRVEPSSKSSGKIMEEFDPAAEEILFLPVQMVGGG